MSKHLSLTDRALLEKFIAQDFTFAYIARRLHRSPATISREVKLHRCFTADIKSNANDCLHYSTCHSQNICPFETKRS